MANFITNSLGTKALRLSTIYEISIVEFEKPAEFRVIVKNGSLTQQESVFEIADTLQQAQALAIPLMEALEASE